MISSKNTVKPPVGNHLFCQANLPSWVLSGTPYIVLVLARPDLCVLDACMTEVTGMGRGLYSVIKLGGIYGR